MRRLIVVAAFLIVASLLHADELQKVREGVALFDAGRIDEAIAKYKEALAENPQSGPAAYELALAYASKGDYKACSVTLEPFASVPSSTQLQRITLLGNCLDSGGDRKKAIEVYRRGQALDPNDPPLNYELGLVLFADGKFAEAREALKKDTLARPGHVNGRFYLAMTFEADDFRIPALMEFLHYLALEPSRPQMSELAAKHVRNLISAGVTEKDAHNIELKIDPEEKTEEGDYKGFSMAVAIVAASRFTDDAVKKNSFERARDQIANTINVYLETVPATQRDYTAQSHLPFFMAMKKADLIDTFAGVVLLTQKIDGGDEWGRKNQAAVQRFAKWVEPYRNARAAVEMPVPK